MTYMFSSIINEVTPVCAQDSRLLLLFLVLKFSVFVHSSVNDDDTFLYVILLIEIITMLFVSRITQKIYFTVVSLFTNSSKQTVVSFILLEYMQLIQRPEATNAKNDDRDVND